MYRTIRIPVCGIEIRVTVAWLIVAVALTAIAIYSSLPQQLESTSSQLRFLAIAAIGITCAVALHELSHVFVARRVGVAFTAVSPQLAGTLPDNLFDAHDPASEVKVGLAGPVTSTILGCVFATAWWWSSNQDLPSISMALGLVALFNLGMAVVSIMPGYPFDGGRVARGVFWYLSGDLLTATKLVGYAGYIIIMAGMTLGVVLIVSGGTNAVWGVLVLLTAFMINRSVGVGLSHIFWVQNSRRLRVDDVFIGGTRRIQRDVKIDEAIERLLEGLEEGPMLVFDGSRAIGLVDLASIRPVPRRHWAEKNIGDVMHSIDRLESTTTSSRLSELIELLPPDQDAIALITRNGSVIGATNREDVVRRLQQYLAAERIDKMRRRRS